LELNNRGCKNYIPFSVRDIPRNSIKRITIYPNPSSTGIYNATVSLDKIASLQVTVFAEDGSLISKKEYTGLQHYNLSEKLSINGLYFIVFKSGMDMITKELLISK
jgi:hypothetical protein